ncbi:Trafficking protein particle complex subunit 4, partial [Trichinella nativa]
LLTVAQFQFSFESNFVVEIKKLSSEETAPQSLSELLETEKALDTEIELLESRGYRVEDLDIYIEKLHVYNDLKDLCQMLLGQLAVLQEVTTRDLYKSFDLIFDCDYCPRGVDIEISFNYPIDIKLQLIDSRPTVAFGERNGVNVGYIVTEVNGRPVASGGRVESAPGMFFNLFDYLSDPNNFPLMMKFSKPSLTANEKIILSSMFHSFHAIGAQLSPCLGSGGICQLITDTFRLQCFQSYTGLKFLAICDLCTGDLEPLLHRLYELYSDYALKNPFYSLDMPIRCELFDQASIANFSYLTRLSSQCGYLVLNDDGAILASFGDLLYDEVTANTIYKMMTTPQSGTLFRKLPWKMSSIYVLSCKIFIHFLLDVMNSVRQTGERRNFRLFYCWLILLILYLLSDIVTVFYCNVSQSIFYDSCLLEKESSMNFTNNMKNIILPEPCQASMHEFVVFVPVRVWDVDVRDAIRRTWMQNLNTDIRFKMFFVLALPVIDSIHAEAKLHNDVLLIDVVDSYFNISHKVHQALQWIDQNCPKVKYIIRVDPDVVLFKDRLMVYLEERWSPLIRTVVGYCRRLNCVVRMSTSKWCMPRHYFSPNIYPPFCAGYTYILTADLLKPILSHWPSSYFHLDDVLVTGLLAGKVTNMRMISEEFLFDSEKPFDDFPCHRRGPIVAASYPDVEQLIFRWFAYQNRCAHKPNTFSLSIF